MKHTSSISMPIPVQLILDENFTQMAVKYLGSKLY